MVTKRKVYHKVFDGKRYTVMDAFKTKRAAEKRAQWSRDHHGDLARVITEPGDYKYVVYVYLGKKK